MEHLQRACANRPVSHMSEPMACEIDKAPSSALAGGRKGVRGQRAVLFAFDLCAPNEIMIIRALSFAVCAHCLRIMYARACDLRARERISSGDMSLRLFIADAG